MPPKKTAPPKAVEKVEREEEQDDFVDEDGLPTWGRVLIAGGTDYPRLGRGPKPSAASAAAAAASTTPYPDLAAPHILRGLSNVRVHKIYTSHSGCHALFLTTRGDVYVIGRNDHGQLGFPPSSSSTATSATFEPVRLDRSQHFSPPLPASRQGDIVHAAAGRHHSLLVTRAGTLYASGNGQSGQTGLGKEADVHKFTRVESAPWIKAKDRVVKVACGITFSVVITASGLTYAFGSSEKGQLGNGKTGEHFVSSNRLAFTTYSEPIPIKALADKKIIDISCGQQHAMALDKEGYVYVWGFGGYGRLGLGSQHDALLPALVQQFARDNEKLRAVSIAAGPACSVIIDGQKAFWLAGKWKTSGDGSGGQGFMTYKLLPDLMGIKCNKASLGGVTLWAIAPEDASFPVQPHKPTLNVSWGQNAANGELALGEGKPRSATKPQRCETLNGLALLDIGAGQNTTYFIVRNQGEAFSDLPRWPPVESAEVCLVCGKDETEETKGDLLECEKCENPWHTKCLAPPLEEVPEGEWHCPNCEAEESSAPAPSKASGKGKRPAEADAEDAPPQKGKKKKV